ncbi:hypothetical protein [Burkholderia cepacia]|uniref:hypothetical protein n=1 Tax=Burkholderia cepacia TaxID=292 RepID=UPI00398E44C4
MTTENSHADALPDRDQSKTDAGQGLYRKYIVHRAGGRDQPGGEHHDCKYFVLDTTHDQHARAALQAYAAACMSTHPDLSADFIARYGLTPASQPIATSIDEPRERDTIANRSRCPAHSCSKRWTSWHRIAIATSSKAN